jgi:peptide/nickel transport system substrate-binding protein
MGKRRYDYMIALILGLSLSLCSLLTAQTKDLPKERLVPEITFINASPAYDPKKFEAANLITKNWEQLGLKVNMVTLDFTPLYDRIQKKTDWDAFVCGWAARAERIDPDAFLYMLFKTGEITNMMRYSHPEVDKLLEAQRQEVDINKRKDMILTIQETVGREVPSITLFHLYTNQFYNSQRFSNCVPTVEGLVNVWAMKQMKPISGDGFLKIAHIADIDTINPLAAKHWEKESPLPMIYDRLAILDNTGKPVPSVAESWKAVDNKTYEVTIRKGIKFHDGKPLTAEDVKFSYDFQKEWEVEYVTRYLKKIKEIQVLDPYKVRFKLESPYAPFFTVIFNLTGILPKHIWQDVIKRENVKRPHDWPNPNPIGSGAFKFVYWRRGEEFKLVRNNDYFDPPKIAGYIQHNYAHHDAVLLALDKGEADLNFVPFLPSHAEEAKKIKHLTDISVPTIRLDHLGFNCQNSPFKRMELRQAFAHTIDYDKIVQTVLMGKGMPGRGVIAPSNKFWFNPNQKFYEFNMEKAKKILKDAGYEWGSDGRLYYPAK